MTDFPRISKGLVYTTIALAPWCIGGTRVDVQMALALPVMVAMGLMLVSVPRRRSPYLWSMIVVSVTALPSCLQLIPLPMSLLELLSPNSARLYLMAHPELSMAPISVDVLSTARAAIHQCIFGMVVVLVVTSGRSATKIIAWIIVANGALMTAVAMIHSLLGLDQVLGFYDSLHREKVIGFVGPFVNPNTLAGYLVLSTFSALGLAVSEEDSSRLRFALIAGLVSMAGVVLTESRGGLVALGVGCIFFTGLAISLPTEDRPGLHSRMRGVSVALLIALCMAIGYAWTTQDDWRSLTQAALLDDGKVQAWNVLGAWLTDYGTVGSGRGTFEYVYPQFQTSAVEGTVTHAENIVVQMLMEYGHVLGSIVLSLGLFVCIFATYRFRTHRRGVLAGALVAVAAVLLQQGLDFGLESMGLSLSIAALLGCLFTEPGEKLSVQRARMVMVGPFVIGCVLLCVYGPDCYAMQSDGHFERLRSAESVERIREDATYLARRHPADGLVPLTTAAQLMKVEPLPLTDIIHWSNRAQSLWPHHGAPHEVAGRAFLRAGKIDQAAGEFRRAMEKSPWRTRPLLDVLSVKLENPSELIFATPENEVDQTRLLNALMRNGRPDMVLAVTNELFIFEPDAMHLHHGRTRACLRIRNFDCVADEVAFMKSHGRAALARVFEARIAIGHKDFETARNILRISILESETPDESVLRQAVRAYADMNDYDNARECLNRLWLISRLDSGKARDVLAQKARLEWRAGDYPRCRDAADRALTLLKSPDLTLLAGRAEVKMELLKTAEKRLWRARKRWPQNTQIKTEYARIQSLVERGPDRKSMAE